MTNTADTPGSDSGSQTPVPQSALKTFLHRGFSTLILLAVLIGVYYSYSPWAYLGLFAVFCLVSSLEWRTMLKTANIEVCGKLIVLAGVCFPLLAGIPLLKMGAGIADDCAGKGIIGGADGPTSILIVSPYISTTLFALMAALCLAVYMIFVFLWQLGRSVEKTKTFLSIGGSLVAFVYPVWMFCFALPILFCFGRTLDDGVKTLLWVLLVTKIMDMGAYVSGSLFGKHKMIPHISPKKTWEGFLGACVITVAAGILFKNLWSGSLPFGEWSMLKTGLFALFLGLVSVVGDLAGSVIKRALGVKDSGKILPGIGGVYDLIDSPAFTMPVACLFFLFI